ncbi:hypothetical protein AAMO2058_000660900 [Amorphochlora amoebiformis]
MLSLRFLLWDAEGGVEMHTLTVRTTGIGLALMALASLHTPKPPLGIPPFQRYSKRSLIMSPKHESFANRGWKRFRSTPRSNLQNRDENGSDLVNIDYATDDSARARFVEGVTNGFKERMRQAESSISGFIHDIKTSTDRRFVLMRGISGSGKSTLASRIMQARNDSVICGADMFFHSNDTYIFNPQLLPQAHAACLGDVLAGMVSNASLIVVDNTHTRHWEYENYLKLAQMSGYIPYVVEVECNDSGLAHILGKRARHGVSIHGIQAMRIRWEGSGSSDLCVSESISVLAVPPFLTDREITEYAYRRYNSARYRFAISTLNATYKSTSALEHQPGITVSNGSVGNISVL